jgi:uncharacterized protein YktA (UPF0223 family)
MSNWNLVGKYKHYNILPQKTESEKRLKAKFENDMSYWRSKNEHISPAVAQATIEDWLS